MSAQVGCLHGDQRKAAKQVAAAGSGSVFAGVNAALRVGQCSGARILL